MGYIWWLALGSTVKHKSSSDESHSVFRRLLEIVDGVRMHTLTDVLLLERILLSFVGWLTFRGRRHESSGDWMTSTAQKNSEKNVTF